MAVDLRRRVRNETAINANPKYFIHSFAPTYKIGDYCIRRY